MGNLKEYLIKPNICLSCGKNILPKENEKLSNVICRKFCCRSCSAIYNNKLYPKRHKIEKIKLNKKELSFEEKRIKKLNQQKEFVKRRRKKVKEMAIKYKGGKCTICGYNRCNNALDFHHIDPEEKSFGIGRCGCSKSWQSIKVELDKCILVCSNCHREIHSGIIDVTNI